MKKVFFSHLFLVVSFLTVSSLFSLTATAQEPEKQTILVLGDSLSAGYGFPKDKGWVNLLRQKLNTDKPQYKVINGSISGDTTSQGIGRLPSLLKEYSPEIVVIELGGNDGLRGFPPKAIKKNLATLIDMAKAQDAEVILLGIQILPNYGKRYSDAFYNNYLELAKEKNVTLVPEFLKGVGLNKKLMQKDGVHPNEIAQVILMNNVIHKLYPHISFYQDK